jgi:hypothetical protein
MNFINRVSELFNISIDNNVMDTFNKINNGQSNMIYHQITQQVENVSEPNQFCSLNYLAYLIISTFTKNKHHPYNPNLDNYRYCNISDCIDELVYDEHIKYLTQGEIKLIMNELVNQNYNRQITDSIVSILDILSMEQLFILVSINSNINGRTLVSPLVMNSQMLYMVNDLHGNDYFSLHYDFEIGNEDKEFEIQHLENVYNENEMLSYFSFSINKLFNSECGITPLNSELGMTHRQLAYCIYYSNHPTMNVQERFHKFANVLTLDQLTYVGV